VSTSPSVISIGSFGDSSFEADVSQRLHAFSHSFDFSLNPAKKAHMASRPYLKFYDMGLAGEDMVPSMLKTFKTKFPNIKVVTVPQMLAVTGAQVRGLLQNRL